MQIDKSNTHGVTSSLMSVLSLYLDSAALLLLLWFPHSSHRRHNIEHINSNHGGCTPLCFRARICLNYADISCIFFTSASDSVCGAAGNTAVLGLSQTRTHTGCCSPGACPEMEGGGASLISQPPLSLNMILALCPVRLEEWSTEASFYICTVQIYFDVTVWHAFMWISRLIMVKMQRLG